MPATTGRNEHSGSTIASTAALYLLNYIDSPSLGQNVQKAVNRGENYHQLRRAISFASFGKLRFKTEYEQDLWSECSRLIANCIIFYNASILSRAPGT
jgi:TnpA family transposase